MSEPQITVMMTEEVTYTKTFTMEQLVELTGAEPEAMLHLFNEYDSPDLSDVLDSILEKPDSLAVTEREWQAAEQKVGK